MNYRAFEDRHGFIKFFINTDAEFEIVLKGLDSLKGSSKWGRRAKELEERFVRAMDGLISHKLPPKLKADEDLPEAETLYDEFMNALRMDDFYFHPCDQLTFRKIHDDCIRFFKEVRDAYNVLLYDDRNDYAPKR